MDSNDIFIIDTLGVERNLLKILSERKIKKISLDEINLKYFKYGIIINGILFAKKKIYKSKNIKVYQGPQYIILNEDYKKRVKTKVFKYNNLSAVVTSGGADYKNFLYNISNSLIYSKLKKIYVVIGKSVKKNSKIFKLKSKKLIKLYNLPSLKKIFDKSNIVVCTGGTVMFEAIACGKKPYVFQNYNHQKYAISFFSKKNKIFSYKKPSLRNINRLLPDLNKLYLKKYNSNNQKKKLIDGKGLQRCVKILENYIKK